MPRARRPASVGRTRRRTLVSITSSPRGRARSVEGVTAAQALCLYGSVISESRPTEALPCNESGARRRTLHAGRAVARSGGLETQDFIKAPTTRRAQTDLQTS